MGIFRRLSNLIWKIWIQMKQIQDGILVKRRCGYCGYKFWFDTSGMSVPVNDIIFVCSECEIEHFVPQPIETITSLQPISPSSGFMLWFSDWYKGDLCSEINIEVSIPSGSKLFKEDNVVILDNFDFILYNNAQNLSFKNMRNTYTTKALNTLLDKADQFGVTFYLEPKNEYWIGYFMDYGFELTKDKQFMKRQKRIYESNCCQSEYETKFNGLYNYYVCKTCWQKTEPKKPDMRLKENKLKYGKKGTK